MKGLKDDHRQRISDELRQLKQMSNRLRTKSLQALMERHAAKREAAKPATPVKLPATASRAAA